MSLGTLSALLGMNSRLSHTNRAWPSLGPFNNYLIGINITNAELSGPNPKLAKFHGDWITHSFRNDRRLDQLISRDS